MLGTIQKGIVQIFLNAIPTLTQSGSEFATGWAGVARARTQQVWDNTGTISPGLVGPLPDYVNLFDRPYNKGAESELPAIFMGASSHEGSDKQNGPLVNKGHVIENRAIDIPIVIAVSDVDYYICRDKRNQLRFNVKKIILANIVNSTTWWSLMAPGEAGGGELSEHIWMTDTGQSATGRVEGFCVIPVRVKYAWSKDTPFA